MNEQKQIGFLIKELRELRDMTQAELAKALSTSQSVVARMEKGEQNFSTKGLAKISKVLGYPVVSISENATDDFEIHGGKKLHGSITTNTSKNGALHLMCTALLNKAPTTLHGIPNIEEIKRMIEVFESIGVETRWVSDNSLVITPPEKFNLKGIKNSSAKKMRSTIMLIPSLIHFVDEFALPHAGGCKMGERTTAAHRFGLEPFGIKIKSREEDYLITKKKLKSAEVTLYESSDTATTNILRAAALIPKRTVIHFATQNYMVQDVIGFLRKMGVLITQTGPATLEVIGVNEMNQPVEYWNSEDPIESMAFVAAGIVTESELTVTRCPIDFLRLELLKLKKMGLKYDISKPYPSHNGFTMLADITVFPSKLKSLHDKIHPLPYPGINVDNLPFFVPIATQAHGSTLVHDWMWENRAIYFTELNRLGADIKLADPHRVFINGPTKLRPAQIVCPPALRPSMIIMVAMLAAPGKSILRNVYAIKRGYEDLPKRLQAIGADVKVVKSL